MKIALVCPASLPATQFGGILFLCVDLAKEFSKSNNNVTIYTTDLDFANKYSLEVTPVIIPENKDIANYPDQIMTEEQWNVSSTSNHNAYSYSKTIAEKEAWSISKKQNSRNT